MSGAWGSKGLGNSSSPNGVVNNDDKIRLNSDTDFPSLPGQAAPATTPITAPASVYTQHHQKNQQQKQRGSPQPRNQQQQQGQQLHSSSAQPPPSAPASSAAKQAAAAVVDYFVVLDFEATCEKDKRLKQQEVIEFPLVVVDPASRTIVAEFQRYVRPVAAPTLSTFCTELTGITQQAVDRADPFPVVLREVTEWLRSGNLSDDPATGGFSYCFVTCGDWDLKTMLPIQLRYSHQTAAKDMPTAIPQTFSRWVNVKSLFPHFFPRVAHRAKGMDDMLHSLGLELDGRHHSGIDDCRNIAKILCKMLEVDPAAVRPTMSTDGTSHTDPSTNSWQRRANTGDALELKSSLVAAENAPPSSQFDPNVVKRPRTEPGSCASASVSAPALAVILQLPPPARAPSDQQKTSFSKKLALILRHRAAEFGVQLRPDGTCDVDMLLSLPHFKHLDLYTLGRIVADCPKQRYRILMEEDSATGKRVFFIGANQGHTIAGVEAELRPITSAAECPVAVHGTYFKPWDIIKKTGLSRMARQHIHLARGIPGTAGVISTMRQSAQVYIYLNVAKCLADGIPLFESLNGVILSPGVGDTGCIPPQYFEKVINATDNSVLPL